MRNHYQQLKECEQAFRSAGIFEAYCQLDLPNYLTTQQNVDELAAILKLNPSAFERFLNATTFLGLTKKLSNKIYQHKQIIHYSVEPTTTLIAFVEQKFADQLASPHWVEASKSLTPEIKRFLDKSAEFGLIEKKGSGEYGLFEETRRYLLSSSKQFIWPKLFHYKHIMLKTFEPHVIINALRENKSQWLLISENKAETAFDLYQTKPELLEIFTRGMHNLNSAENNVLAEKIKTTGNKTVLDIGGGSGAFALALLEQNPQLKISIYEHPDAITLMTKILRENTDENTFKKINYIAGDFLVNLDAPSFNLPFPYNLFDIICMTWILHDWPDEVCIALLKKAYNHLSQNGQLVIAEEILPEDQVSSSCIGDITMLLHTAGKERRLSDFKRLLLSSNFREQNIELISTDTRRKLIIARNSP